MRTCKVICGNFKTTINIQRPNFDNKIIEAYSDIALLGSNLFVSYYNEKFVDSKNEAIDKGIDEVQAEQIAKQEALIYAEVKLAELKYAKIGGTAERFSIAIKKHLEIHAQCALAMC